MDSGSKARNGFNEKRDSWKRHQPINGGSKSAPASQGILGLLFRNLPFTCASASFYEPLQDNDNRGACPGIEAENEGERQHEESEEPRETRAWGQGEGELFAHEPAAKEQNEQNNSRDDRGWRILAHGTPPDCTEQCLLGASIAPFARDFAAWHHVARSSGKLPGDMVLPCSPLVARVPIGHVHGMRLQV